MGILKKLKGAPNRKKAETLVEKGWAEKNAGRLQSALKHYRAAIKKDPTYALAKHNEGLALLDLLHLSDDVADKGAHAASLEEARHSFAMACALDDEHMPSFRMRMHTSAKLGRFLEAQSAAEHIINTAPVDYAHLEEANGFKKRVGEDAEIEQLLVDVEADLTSLRQGEPDDAEKEGTSARMAALLSVNEGAKATAQSLILAGRLSIALGHDSAEEFFHRALEMEPGAKVHRDLSNLFAARGDADRALPHALEAYRDEPTDAARVCNVGVCYMELGDMPNATEFLHIAQGLDPQGAIIARALERLEILKQR